MRRIVCSLLLVFLVTGGLVSPVAAQEAPPEPGVPEASGEGRLIVVVP